jgi:two-component system alkaline phosphatase synthesis response regulator PhoP
MRQSRVLVVDDEPDIVEMLKMALERQFEVIIAYDGTEGLARAREDKPDAIVLDIMMPGMDGFAVCRELKKDSTTLSIPILILTSVGDYFGRTKYPKMGGMEIEAEDFLSKPVDPNVLLRRVAALLPGG